MRLGTGRYWRTAVIAVVALFGCAALPASAGVMEEGAGAPLPPARTVPLRGASLWIGFSELLRYEAEVGTIVVGDVSIVDATVIDARSVVLTALKPGRTNVIVLGQHGWPLARLSVRVRAPRPPAAVVYRGTQRSVMNCDPHCVPANDSALATVE